MTTAEEYEIIRTAVADGIAGKPTDALDEIILVEREDNSVGPLGGVSSRLFFLAFVDADEDPVPVMVNVYADERIDLALDRLIAVEEAKVARSKSIDKIVKRARKS